MHPIVIKVISIWDLEKKKIPHMEHSKPNCESENEW